MSLALNGLCLILYVPVTLSFGEFRVQKRRYRVQIPCTFQPERALSWFHRDNADGHRLPEYYREPRSMGV